MKIIKPSFEILDQQYGLEGIYKQIEIAGRVCYKSEDKITEDSANKFVDKLIKLNHKSALEHGTVYLYGKGTHESYLFIDKYGNNPYSKIRIVGPSVYITTNYRVLIENNWLDDLQYLCKPTEHHKKRITVRFICDRGVSHELVRHRKFSFSQESTRYCNYSMDKFGNQLTFIIPCWMPKIEYYNEGYYGIFYNEGGALMTSSRIYEDIFKYLHFLEYVENQYLEFIKFGWEPQQARAILPNSIKTELIMTGFIEDWEYFFSLRAKNTAHPQTQELVYPLQEEFIKRGFKIK